MSFGHINDDLNFVDLDGCLEMLSGDLTDALRSAKGDVAKQKLVLCHYYKSGIKAGISQKHLTSHLGDEDFFIFDIADYTDEDRKAVWGISESLKDDEINEAELQ